MAQKESTSAFKKNIVEKIDDINMILDKHNIFINIGEKPNTIMLTIIREQSESGNNDFEGDLVFNINNIQFANSFPFNSKPFLHYATVLRDGKRIKKHNEPWIGKKTNGQEKNHTMHIDDIQNFFYGRDPTSGNAIELVNHMGNATRMLADGFIRMVKELESSNILDEMARKAGVDIATNPYQVLTNHLKRKTRSVIAGKSNNNRIDNREERKRNQNSGAVKVAETTELVPREGRIIPSEFASAALGKERGLGHYIGNFIKGGKKRRRKKKSRRKRKSKKHNKRKTLKGKKKRRSRKR
tara:strand:- start:941 stop:1834 length:894 start_codon:yes stop_codon:yes gene_type:complete